MSDLSTRSRWARRVVTSLLMVSTSFAQKDTKPTVPATTAVTTDSYRVYSALLVQQYRAWFRKNLPVKISAYTTVPSHGPGGSLIAGCTSGAENDADRDLIKELSSDNVPREKLEAKLVVPGSYLIVNGRADIREGIEPGIVWLSRVAFSKDRKHAMVWLRNFCGSLCGSGMMWKLELTTQGWRVIKNIPNCGFIS
ncbi:MAG TPA: hypothetical protein VN911_19005 [Candidatus Acidoferrum sp.]|nr:hypothetical protein [Candidatus Acidoferrum sp.]